MPAGQYGQLDDLAINTIRSLAMDAVQKANSGHPGMPMGAAAMAYVLWTRFLAHNPTNPKWPNRDRFVLSAGHGSMLLYSLLHLTGYDLPLDELKRFRQLDSKTPGHPEYGLTPGVETTTGPLGQGFATGVGMAMAERHLAARYNRPGHEIISHYVYSIVSDGDLMEGVSSEAASLAGHLKLGKLVYLYDDNHITIDGATDLSFSEDVGARFRAYGWSVFRVEQGNDLVAIEEAIAAARSDTERPSLIMVRTHIGYGSPNKQDKSSSHGAPLGADEVLLARKQLGWTATEDFYIPDEALSLFRGAVNKGRQSESEWDRRFQAYRAAFPDEAGELGLIIDGKLPQGWADAIPTFNSSDGSMATRVASGKTLNAIISKLPMLLGGSADLAASNDTNLKGLGNFLPGSYDGRNINWGVREHAMAATMNGITLSGLRVFGGTFLIFSDYLRPSLRLAALMGIPTIYVMTHDSIGLGEDGPTHQPIEQLPSLRAMSNLTVIRPADANETAQAWKVALESEHSPVVLALSRQSMPIIDRGQHGAAENLAKGAYVLAEAVDGAGKTVTPEIIIIGTGAEVPVALEARSILAGEGIAARVVSMPSWELFARQSQEYRDSILPPAITKRAVVEAAMNFGWERWIGMGGLIIAMESFGASAPLKPVMERFGFTGKSVAGRVKTYLGR